jgi:hypothetical protein
MTENSQSSFFIKPSGKGVKDFEDLIKSDYQIKIGEWLASGWILFKKDAGLSIAFAVLAGICYLLLSSIPFASLLILYPIMAGFIIVALMTFSNKSVGFKNYLWGFRHFIPLLVFSIISTIVIVIGLFLLVIPGIYLAVAYLFTPYLIVDENIDFWPAMEISRKKVNKHWFGLFAFSMVIILLNLAGCLPLFLGLFITIPLSIAITTAAYKDIFVKNKQIEENADSSSERNGI